MARRIEPRERCMCFLPSCKVAIEPSVKFFRLTEID